MGFAENIKELRKQKGWSQKEAADKLEIKKSNLGAYEEGRARPRLETLEKFVAVYQPPDILKFLFN